MNIIGIIPARGDSKGIPHKNLCILHGKPLIAWTIEAAKGAKRVDRIVVSTDEPKISSIAKQYGSEVIWRPAEISGDTALSESALLHVLEHLRQNQGYEPDIVIFLQCTSPLILSEDIDGIVQTFLNEGADSALAVVPFHDFLWKKNARGKAVGINHNKSVRIRRQDLKPQYQETGAIYVMKTKGFRKAKHRFFGKIAMNVIPTERAYEINEPVDMQVAEALFQQREKHRI